MNQSFEQTLTQGKAQWIASCVHDASTSQVVIHLTHDTNDFKPTRIIEFSGVASIEHRWTARDESCAEGLLGAHEDESGTLHRYSLVTDQREIELTSSHRAQIKDV